MSSSTLQPVPACLATAKLTTALGLPMLSTRMRTSETAAMSDNTPATLADFRAGMTVRQRTR